MTDKNKETQQAPKPAPKTTPPKPQTDPTTYKEGDQGSKKGGN